jgi:glycosyltransferase involved in cell wall biosynthesis
MVFEVRDLWPEVPIAMGALSFPFSKMLARMLEQWAYNNATRVVALSPGMAAGVERSGYPRSRIECIPNSADIDLFDVPRSQGEVFRQDRPWLGDRPLVVYSGTFGKVNGVSYLVELASHMLSLDPEVRFLAVGRGIERQAVEDRARALGVLGQIFFMEGAMLKNDMPALLSASSICVSLVIPLEALWHNSANKFFDALAAGRPVAINYGGWQAGLLLDAGAGIVLDPDNPAQGALQLHSFLQNKLALSQACEAAGALARERFSRDALASRLIALLEDVVEDEKRTRVEG